MNTDDKLTMDDQFAKIAETRRPNSLEWMKAHQQRLERFRLEPDFAAYMTEMLFCKVEDLSLALSRQWALQAQNGQRGFGHLGQPPAGKARGQS